MSQLCVLALPARAYVIYIPYTITVPAAEVGNYQNIHTIGIVSAIGGKLRLYTNRGFLATSTQYRDITDWKIDDLVRSIIHQTMGTRFNLIDMPVDAATVADKIDPGLFLGNMGPIRSFLKAYNRNDIDAYILVRPRYYADFPGSEAGLSLEAATDPLSSWLYANYEITLIDGKTFAPVGQAFARMRLDDGTPPHFPGISPPHHIIPDSKLGLDERQTTELKGWMTTLVRLSMIETLRSLQLGVDLPRAGGRAVTARGDSQLPLPAGKSLAVVSALGDTLFLEHRGTMFRHSERSIAIADLKLDAIVEAQVAAALDHRFTVKPAPAGVDRASLAARPSDGTAPNVFAGLPAAPDIDAYVVVLKRDDSGDDKFPHNGLGLTNLTPIDDEHTSALANYSIVVVDARTFKRLYETDGVPSPDRQTQSPTREIDNALWPDEKPLTAVQGEGLRKVFTDLMADSVPETLLRLGFTDKMVVRPGRPQHAPHPATADADSGAETSQAKPKPPQQPAGSETNAKAHRPDEHATAP